ncbi:DUF397 domain-containing protein [Saccharopolyspora gloriosae]|uniref:DUF397 domain-containing protein n=1 Tax=Saccharopolyspora gloriosae TaxID=455344 RepID=A0A840NT38_9PSEU|nr:DUF397 domain-containing protein [Saccharopolyspora gloriosae]MBB5071357.1 hypothetical protein [Saccharopolyspora gloriosae]
MNDYDTGWFKSSHSAASSNACVEVRLTERAVSVRDSKDPHGGELSVGHRAWAEFLRWMA